SDDPIDIGFGGDTNRIPGDSNAELMEERLPPKRMRLEDLVLQNPLNVPNARPWAPFPTLVDFEFTEQLITDGRSKASISRLLRDMHNGKFAEACKISFKNGKQLFSCLDEFKRETFEFSFRRSNVTSIQLKYSVWVKDGMAWMRELFQHVIDEPLSGDAAWEIEGQLDQGTQQVQVPLILYSDKSDVARFASLSVWPVLTRLASLPKHLSNKN
ncbi:1009_t:CDS:2, partial [Acaulospora colombiana]